MKLLNIIILVGIALRANSATIPVKNTQELKEAMTGIRPGDTLVLQNKEWKDAALQLKGIGTAQKPIVIRAESPGGVVFSGNSYVQLGGEYLIFSGFHFKNGYSPKREVISFRIDNKTLANHCRVTGIVIENYSQPERFKTDSWLTLYGKYNRIDHSTFGNKLNAGPLLIAELDDERSQQNEHQIDSNYFKGRTRFGSNGGETIRIGVSRYSLTASRTHIVHNYFEHCNGEVEIVSIKSGENVVNFNTFFECEGGLVLRHGSGNVVEGNLFVGNNKPYTGGVRVINPKQKVLNNVFFQLRGTQFRAALSVLNGVPNSLINRYYQVTDADIERNTFIDCSSVLFGAGKDAERTLSPQKVSFKNNLIINHSKQLYEDANQDKGIQFHQNAVGSSFKGQLPEGFIRKAFVQLNKGELTLPYDEKAGANLPQLSFITKSETGAQWYQPEILPSRSAVQVYKVSAAQAGDLPSIVSKALSGDTILLTESTNYLMKESLIVDKPLIIQAASGLKKRPVLVNGSFKSIPAFIIIENGGALKVKGLAFKGAYESYGNVESGIMSSEEPMNKPYVLKVDGCEFFDFNESTQSGFKGSKGTLADSLLFQNSIFHHMSGSGINLATEKDDKGIYNAEYTIIRNCIFSNLLGSAINVYRGGNDESTLGPFVTIDHCTFNEVENREQGTVIRLIGAQQADVKNCLFSESGQGGRSVQFQEYRWDKISVDHCNFYASGKIESFYNKAAGKAIFSVKPIYKNAKTLDFRLMNTLPKAKDGTALGANF